MKLKWLKHWIAPLLPDQHVSSVKDIDYDRLYAKGIRTLLFDVDNTLVERLYEVPEWKIKKLMDELASKGFRCLLLSNNTSSSRILKVADFLELTAVFGAYKPLPWVYRKLAIDLDVVPRQAACIGDQLFMDVLGANLAGYYSIYVDPLALELKNYRRLYIAVERLIISGVEWLAGRSGRRS